MTQRSFFIFLFVFALLNMSGCEVDESEQMEERTPAVLLGAQCILGTNMMFPLDVDMDPNGNFEPDYSFKIATGSYSASACLCEVTSYVLDFQTLPDIGQVELFDDNGVPVPFIHIHNPDPAPGIWGDRLILNQIGELEGPIANVFLNFIGDFHAMTDAGGLCVVENFGGGYPVDPQTLPLKDLVPNIPPLTGFRTRIFVPTQIATPI